jgi:hypothetical protein
MNRLPSLPDQRPGGGRSARSTLAPPVPFSPLDLWDFLASFLCVRRELAKQWAYVIFYRGSIDPWVDHLVTTGIEEFCEWIFPHST